LLVRRQTNQKASNNAGAVPHYQFVCVCVSVFPLPPYEIMTAGECV
jgi:hypothetical protein